MKRVLSVTVSPVIIFSIMLLLTGSAAAVLQLNQEWSAVIPGLQEDILAVSLRDANGDGIPELLVSDGAWIVFYDAANDTTLFKQDLPDGWDIVQVLAADVNRDDTVDLVVAGYVAAEWAPDVIVAAFDGGSAYTQVDSMRHAMQEAFTYSLGESLKELASGDFDFDGEAELLVSFDSTLSSDMVGVTRGVTYCFDSFPDQLSFHRGVLVSQMQPLTFGPIDSLVLGVRHQNSFTEVGPDQVYIGGAPCVFSEAGRPGAGMASGSVQCAEWPYDLVEYTHTTYSWCAGDIHTTTPEAEVVSSQRAAVMCNDYTGWSSSATSVLAMHRVISRDSVELVWSREVAGPYGNLVWYPGYPGIFFGMTDYAVVQFAADGSVIGQSATLPSGNYFWTRPYADSLPRLAGYSGNEVVLYTLDVATDAEGEELLPLGCALHQNYPNPFNPSTTIRFDVPRRSRVSLAVQNVLGQEVRRLVDGEVAAGEHEVQWDGKDATGQGVASGVYVYRLVTQEGEVSRKMVLMK